MISHRSNTFTVRGADIYNSLPKELRDLEILMESYKDKLDKFLELILDIPRLGRGTNIETKNLDECIRKWRWEVGLTG